MPKLPIRVRLLALALLFLFSMIFTQSISACQDEFQKGDIVEFDFLGKTYQGEVIGFTGTGWPTITFEYNGREKERFFPPSRLALVKAAGDTNSEMKIEAEIREWTDVTGSFKVQAKLLSDRDGEVELEKTDGRVIKLPSNKFSESDIAYLANIKKQNSKDNPFAGGEKKKESIRKPNRATEKSKRAPAITPDASANERVLTDKGWNLTPDAAVVASSNDKVIGFSSGFTKHAFHNRSSGSQLSVDKQYIALALSNPFEKATEIIVADLESGESKPSVRIDIKEAALMAISPDGNVAVTHEKGSGREPGRLEFWNLGETAESTAAWNTASFFDRTGFSPTSGLFVEPSRLLTFGRRVILWDCSKAASIYSFAIRENSKPALSANRKQLAVASGDSVFIVDAASGDPLGSFDPPSGSDIIAFSNDGRLLAGIERSSGAIWVWDLIDYELVGEFSAPPGSMQSLAWVGNKYLLVNGSSLVDVALRTQVWRYHSTAGSVVSGDDGRFWLAGKSKIVPITLPSKKLAALSKKFEPDDLLVLQPGEKVSLQMELPFSPSEKESIRDQVTSMLKANGVTVGGGSDLQLEFNVTKGKQETAEMSSFTDPFGRRGTQTIRYRPSIARIQLKQNDLVVWSRIQSYGPGGMIVMNEGESAQQAADRLCKPNIGFFKAVKMPKFISQLPDGKPLGTSQITEQGIR
jgi:WD40 repeat protein